MDATGRKWVATVPVGKKEIPRGTLESILAQAGLTESEFAALLRRKKKEG